MLLACSTAVTGRHFFIGRLSLHDGVALRTRLPYFGRMAFPNGIDAAEYFDDSFELVEINPPSPKPIVMPGAEEEMVNLAFMLIGASVYYLLRRFISR